MTRDSIHYFTEGVWLWLNFGATLFFLIGFGIRWMQTYQISRGHFLVGAIAVSSVGTYTLVLGLATKFAFLFWPLAGIGTGLWVFYNNWYFHRYDYPHQPQSMTPERVRTFGVDTRIGKFLTRLQPERHQLFGPKAQWIAAVGVVCLVGGFGFARWADAIVAGDRRVVAATQQNARQVANVKAEVTQVLSNAVDTLSKGQAVIAAVVDSNQKENRTSRNEIKSELNRSNTSLNKKLERVNSNVDRVRRSPVIPLSPLRPQLTTPSIPTDKVQPIPQYKRGRKVGYEYDADDGDVIAGPPAYIFNPDSQ